MKQFVSQNSKHEYTFTFSSLAKLIRNTTELSVHYHLYLPSNKKVPGIPDEVLEAALEAGVKTVNLSKNILTDVPSKWVDFSFLFPLYNFQKTFSNWREAV